MGNTTAARAWEQAGEGVGRWRRPEGDEALPAVQRQGDLRMPERGSPPGRFPCSLMGLWASLRALERPDGGSRPRGQLLERTASHGVRRGWTYRDRPGATALDEPAWASCVPDDGGTRSLPALQLQTV